MTPALTPVQKRVLELLQGDLPDGPAPYDILAARAGMTADEFLREARALLAEGRLRKVCALLHHRVAGFHANAMCVWALPEARVDSAGEIMAGFAEVTHCYRRPVSERWPYALFCMIHGRTRESCESVAGRIAVAIHPTDYRLIYSTRELKKQSLRLSY
jgi:siroheme decarboxylase